jgi:hypothetical protein
MSNVNLAIQTCLEQAKSCNSAQQREAQVYATEAVVLAIVAQTEVLNRIGDSLETLIYTLTHPVRLL